MKRKELRETWHSRIQDYCSSGESAATWCQRNEIPPRQLWYWIRKFKNADVPKQASPKLPWASVHIDESSSDEAPLIVKVGFASIEVRPGFDASLLTDVVRTLRALC